jgi:predicted nucleic-acid-binding Zn-ribbon protein
MPIYDPIRLGVQPCKCGRLSNKQHCPKCGAYSYYATKRIATRVNPTDGGEEIFTVYRCRQCGVYYDTWQWENACEAPMYRSNRRQRVEEAEARVQDALASLKPSEADALDKIRSGQAEYGSETRRAGLAALFKNVKTGKRDE